MELGMIDCLALGGEAGGAGTNGAGPNALVLLEISADAGAGAGTAAPLELKLVLLSPRRIGLNLISTVPLKDCCLYTG